MFLYLLRAISFLASIAAIVGFNPIIPTTDVTTVSISSNEATFIRPSIPCKHLISLLFSVTVISYCLYKLFYPSLLHI